MALATVAVGLIAGGFMLLVWLMAPVDEGIDRTMSQRGPPSAVRSTK
jgi:hypothetical protein